jgi:hypothetical protein
VSAFVFILVRAIEYFVVLEGIEAMAKRQKLDVDLRRQLEDREAQVAFLRLRSFQCSTETGAGSAFPSTSTRCPRHRFNPVNMVLVQREEN